MRVKCPGCETLFRLPDPPRTDRPFRARCSECGRTLRVHPGENGTRPSRPLPVPSRGTPVVHERWTPAAGRTDGVLDLLADQRELTWHMTQEFARLRDAIDRQHAVITELAEHVTRPALVPAVGTGAANGSDPGESAGRIRRLEETLANERAIVDRLRHSRLELERRAAEAERELERGRTSLLGRLVLGGSATRP